MFLNTDVIQKYLAGLDRQQAKSIYLLESTTSTNDYFKGKAKTSSLEFCFAEEQTQGRGRLGRAWQTPKGTNIIMSCRWTIPSHITHLNGLSSCISLSLISALKKLNNEALSTQLRCKWPNDLYYQDQKLAGILIELYTQNGRISEAIIGIGLNVNMLPSSLPDPSLINQSWTSLQIILESLQDRNWIAALIIESLENYLNRFSSQTLLDFQNEWQQYDYLKGKQLTLTIGQEVISGYACGINESGYLLIQTASGDIIPCSSGEANILKT